MKKQVELSITHNGKDVVTYPYTKKEHVQFENGMNIDEFVGQDIATPTITHDTTAIKVGVGDSDVSSSVVDSAVNMTIKGQTYQNILPEPTLRNEMQGKSMQRLNEGYDSIETVDGVSKSAILKGQTLVNVDSYYSVDDFSDGQITSLSNDGWVEMVANGNYRNAFTRFNGMIKPNTKYLAVVEVKENTLVNETLPERPFYLFANYSNPDGGVVVPFVDQTKWISQGQKGLFKYILTSRGDLSITTINLRNFVANTTTSGRIIYRTMLIEYVEGMENWDIPFFRGIQSVKMPVLQTLGSNIFDGETERGYIDPFTGQNSNTWNDLRSVGYTEVVGGNKIRILVTHENFSSPKIYEYDENKNFIGKVENHTLSPHAKFVRFSIGGNTDVGGVSQVMLYYGDIVKREYEPYKTNILSTPSDLELRGIGDVKDELNCLTGELTQRIREVTLNGETTRYGTVAVDSYIGEYATHISKLVDGKNEKLYYQGIVGNIGNSKGYILTNGFIQYKGLFDSSSFSELEEGLYRYKGTNHAYICISASRLTEHTFEGVKKFLSENPQSYLVTNKESVIKTVDLSSHGNWEKVVLDGDENWQHESGFAHNNLIEFKLTIGNGNIVSVISDRFATGGNDVERIACTAPRIYIRILKSKVSNLDEFKIWLQQNPTTVWYQTTTTQDNSIREMLSFANGHLQVSSEVENSLLPSVQYEIPTKNSYHMDLMKTNTLYTMKAKTVSGTFTIDGTSYNVNTNGTFTTPTSMTDKLLIMSNKTNEEVMLLEGNVIDKTIPYFKGIKSAFEGEDKIEVLSTGKNLISLNNIIQGNLGDQTGWENTITNDSIISKRLIQDGGRFACGIKIYVKPSTTYTLSFEHYRNGALRDGALIYVYNNSGLWEKILAQGEASNLTFTTKPETEYIVIGVNYGHNISVGEVWETKNIQLEESSAPSSCEPYKSNTTKIPLLSPLRSLSSWVCDELIIDRLNHKAKLIQRVGCVVLDGSIKVNVYPSQEKKNTLLIQTKFPMTEEGKRISCITDTHPHSPYLWTSHTTEGIQLGGGDKYKHTDMRLSKTKVSINDATRVESYLSKNPTTVLYELKTPIVTEIDLEGYPYAYKDGYIFLNSDIAPTTQITYSINQAQQIESANESLQRHEKEISHLQKLIAQYIQVEYKSTLLSLKI